MTWIRRWQIPADEIRRRGWACWRLKENLTCGAHTPVSGEREKQQGVFWSIRKMCTRIRPNSSPRHPEDVENGKYQVEEEL